MGSTPSPFIPKVECSDFPITDYCTLKQHCIFIYFTCIKSFIYAFITVADEADNEDDEDDEDEAILICNHDDRGLGLG